MLIKGSLVAVMGRLGCGKSAFLLSLAGEVKFLLLLLYLFESFFHQQLVRESGRVYIEGAEHFGIGFASQQPWLVSGSIRQNILMHRPYNAARYDKIVDCTALRTDFGQLSNGDRTDVGEDGAALR